MDLHTLTFLKQFAACQAGSTGGVVGLLKFPTWYQYLPSEVVAGKCTPTINFFTNPGQVGLILLALIEILLRVAGIVAVGFVIYGGYQFILSQGNPERATSARNTIINALIGMVIAISATVLVKFVAVNLQR